jgi:hypothetical protein
LTKGFVSSAAVTNPPPVGSAGLLIVSLTQPLSGKVFAALVSIQLTASASSSTGIKRVDFFAATPANTNLLGSVTFAPYTMAWINPPVGVTKIWARAVDATDTPANPVQTNSAPAYIMVTP